MRKNESIIGNIDWPLLSGYIVLLVIGIGTIYSVAYDPEHPNLFDFFSKIWKANYVVGYFSFLRVSSLFN